MPHPSVRSKFAPMLIRIHLTTLQIIVKDHNLNRLPAIYLAAENKDKSTYFRLNAAAKHLAPLKKQSYSGFSC
jgi:hypothetical protein